MRCVVSGYNRWVNILSAIFNGQTGFLKAGQSLAARASRISEMSSNPESQERAAEDLVGLKLDAFQAKANMNVIKVADNLLQEFVQDSLKK